MSKKKFKTKRLETTTLHIIQTSERDVQIIPKDDSYKKGAKFIQQRRKKGTY